jgi:hypothetical protein
MLLLLLEDDEEEEEDDNDHVMLVDESLSCCCMLVDLLPVSVANVDSALLVLLPGGDECNLLCTRKDLHGNKSVAKGIMIREAHWVAD